MPEKNASRLAVASDQAIYLRGLATLLMSIPGVQLVGEARNGQEALAQLELQGATIDLVLTDLVMPQMGGDLLLATMRARGVTTPVVILSGHPLDAQLETLKAYDLSGWLLKPPALSELAQLLATALAR